MKLNTFLPVILWFWGGDAAAVEEPGYHVQSILVEGNKVTKTPIIDREVVFQEGDFIPVNEWEEKLEQTRFNLINTNLFLEVNLSYSVDSLRAVDVRIVVKERWYLSVLPYVILSDRSLNEWWYERGRDLRRLTYGLNVTKYNFTGNADSFQSGVYLGFAPHYHLSYSRPYVDRRKRFGVAARVYYNSRRNMPYRTWNDKLAFFQSDSISLRRLGGVAEFQYRKDYNYFHTAFLGIASNKITDTVLAANPQYYGSGLNRQFLVNLGYEYRADFRDFRQYPLKGTYFAAGINLFFVRDGKNQTNLTVVANRYFPLAEKWFLEIGVRGKASFTRDQAYSLVSGLGYSGNIARGYELYVIDGQYFALNRNTLKFRAFRHRFDIHKIIPREQFSTVPITLYPNVYLDYGYVRNFQPERSNSALSNTLLVGGGVGLDVVTFYNVNVRTYYSVNRMGERKLFFTIGREF